MNSKDIKSININGYDTYCIEQKDGHGSFMLIAIPSNAGKDISDFCGSFVEGHCIKEIDYCIKDNDRFIKAYY